MSRLEMAEYFAAQRGAAKTNAIQNILERDRKSCEKDYVSLLNSLSFRIDTLGIRSPTRLSSNAFWDEYLKTERQLKAEKKRAQSRISKIAPAATKVTGLDGTDTETDDERTDDDDNSGSEDSGERPKKGKKNVVPASAPPGGRKSTHFDFDEKAKPTTASASQRHGSQVYSLDDPEFDDENKRRLRENAMSAIGSDRPDSKQKSHPFIKKMLLAKMEPPKTIEDANTMALSKKKATRAAKAKAEKEKEMKELGLLGQSGEQDAFGTGQQQQEQTQQKRRQSTAVRPALSRARSSMFEDALRRQQAQIVNPLFLDEKKGQELYRILIQQEIKWTRQAVSESSRRNRLSAKKEFAFFS